MNKPTVIVITGPTATGKSALGATLAKRIGGEVVSADSMQVYKLMDIGTAKPSPEEMQGVPHHMLDIVPPWEDYSVARYISDAASCIDDILNRGKTPLIVGGTGLYIDSLLSGRVFSARGDTAQRQELENEYDMIGGEAMLRKLGGFDPESAAKLFANDRKRIVRAIEAYNVTGKTLSRHGRETKEYPPRYEAAKFALTFSDRSKLYSQIDRRVDGMIIGGLEREVRGLLEIGVPSGCTAMQAIGYKEIADAVRCELSIDEAIATIKLQSRRYAKRQLTWLRREQNIHWFMWGDEPEIQRAASEIAYNFDTTNRYHDNHH